MDKKGKMYIDSHCSIRFYKYNEETQQSTITGWEEYIYISFNLHNARKLLWSSFSMRIFKQDCLITCPSWQDFWGSRTEILPASMQCPISFSICCTVGRREAISVEENSKSKVRAIVRDEVFRTVGDENALSLGTGRRRGSPTGRCVRTEAFCGHKTEDLTWRATGNHWSCMGREATCIQKK